MQKLVLTGLVVLFVSAANAQMYKKGDQVEINKNQSVYADSWVNARIVEVSLDKKVYVLRDTDQKLHNIPFVKEGVFIRKPVQALTTSMALNDVKFVPGVDLLKQKIKEEFESDFSEYDSVTISFNEIETLSSYKNNNAHFGKEGGEVYPFKVDMIVRLVSTNKEGVQRKINWQFKRKYLLFESRTGQGEITVAEREEALSYRL